MAALNRQPESTGNLFISGQFYLGGKSSHVRSGTDKLHRTLIEQRVAVGRMCCQGSLNTFDKKASGYELVVRGE